MHKYPSFFPLIALFFIGPLSAHAGARITFDLNKATAVLKAEMNYFGDIESKTLKTMTENIEKQWSGSPTQEGDSKFIELFLIRGGMLRLSAEITMNTYSSIPEAKTAALSNKDVWRNFIRVVPNVIGFGTSVTRFIGGNTAVFAYSDKLNIGTTGAHEFGHLIGLDHASNAHYGDILTGPPPIMLPRGSPQVLPEYSYEPNGRDGTVNPDFRRVSQKDIQELSNAAEEGTVVYEDSTKTRGYIDIGFVCDVKSDKAFSKVFKN